MEGDYRLRPEGPSRKSLIVSFVRQYWDRWGVGPSYGKIGAAMGISADTVRDAVRRAERDQQLRRPGSAKGGVQLWVAPAEPAFRPSPTEAAEVLRQLHVAGFLVIPSTAASTPTIPPLQRVPPFRHLEDTD